MKCPPVSGIVLHNVAAVALVAAASASLTLSVDHRDSPNNGVPDIPEDAGPGVIAAMTAGRGRETAAASGVGARAAAESGLGRLTASIHKAGRHTAMLHGHGQVTAAAEGHGKATAAESGAGRAAAAEAGAGVATAAANGHGKATAAQSGLGRATAAANGHGKATAEAEGAGAATAAQLGAGKATAEAAGAGVQAAQEAKAGVDAAKEEGHGKEIALSLKSGVSTAKSMALGTKKPAGYHDCPVVQNVKDRGFNDNFRGWYDVQGCGKCNDYCRWVGDVNDVSFMGNPHEVQNLDNGRAYWSCALAGGETEYTPAGHFALWKFPKCTGESAPAPCKAVLDITGMTDDESDIGYKDGYRGWYDVQGCGSCNDYCRWVGKSGTGGPPWTRLVHDKSWWSCRLAGSNDTHSPKGAFGQFHLKRCAGPGAPTPLQHVWDDMV